MTQLKEKVKASLETFKGGVSEVGKKFGDTVHHGKHVLEEAVNDAKGVATSASTKLKNATRAAVGEAKHRAKDVRDAAKSAAHDVRYAAKDVGDATKRAARTGRRRTVEKSTASPPRAKSTTPSSSRRS